RARGSAPLRTRGPSTARPCKSAAGPRAAGACLPRSRPRAPRAVGGPRARPVLPREEPLDPCLLSAHVRAAEVDQPPAEPGVEEEVARELGHGRVRAEAAHEVAERAGDAVRELPRQLAHAPRRP